MKKLHLFKRSNEEYIILTDKNVHFEQILRRETETQEQFDERAQNALNLFNMVGDLLQSGQNSVDK